MVFFSSVFRAFVRRAGLGAMFALGFLPASMPCAQAVEGQAFQAKISEVGVWDTNPLMLTQGAKTIYGSTTTPELSYKDESPTHLLAAQGRLDFSQFNETGFNSNDAHVTATLLKRNQRWQAGVAGTIDRDTTRTSDITNFGLNLGTVKHFAYSVSPSLSFSPTPLEQLSLTTSFEKSIYDSSAYKDYSVFSVTPHYTRRLTQQTTALLSVQTQRYQSGGDYKARTDSISPMAGIETLLTPTLTLNLQSGAQASRPQNAFQTNGNWTWNYIFSGAATYKGEANSLSLSALRSRQAYGNGYDTLLTTFELNNRHDVTQRLSWTIGGGYQYTDQSQTLSTNMDSLAKGKTGFIYRMTDELDLNLNYQYRTERFVHTDRTAQENVGKIGLSFRPM